MKFFHVVKDVVSCSGFKISIFFYIFWKYNILKVYCTNFRLKYRRYFIYKNFYKFFFLKSAIFFTSLPFRFLLIKMFNSKLIYIKGKNENRQNFKWYGVSNRRIFPEFAKFWSKIFFPNFKNSKNVSNFTIPKKSQIFQFRKTSNFHYWWIYKVDKFLRLFDFGNQQILKIWQSGKLSKFKFDILSYTRILSVQII